MWSENKEKLQRLVQTGDRFRSIDRDSAVLMNLVTGSRLKLEEREGKIDMCQAIRELRQDAWDEGMIKGKEEGRVEGRVEGRIEGRIEGILDTLSALVRDGILSPTEAAMRSGMSVEEFQAKAAAQTQQAN